MSELHRTGKRILESDSSLEETNDWRKKFFSDVGLEFISTNSDGVVMSIDSDIWID